MQPPPNAALGADSQRTSTLAEVLDAQRLDVVAEFSTVAANAAASAAQAADEGDALRAKFYAMPLSRTATSILKVVAELGMPRAEAAA